MVMLIIYDSIYLNWGLKVPDQPKQKFSCQIQIIYPYLTIIQSVSKNVSYFKAKFWLANNFDVKFYHFIWFSTSESFIWILTEQF